MTEPELPGLDERRAVVGLPAFAEDVQLLALREIIPFGSHRLDRALMRWPEDA